MIKIFTHNNAHPSALLIAFVFSFICTLWGCGNTYRLNSDIDSQFITSNYQGQQSEKEYTIRSGDGLEISFYYNPELNTEEKIRPDGFISMQLIGEVEVEGQTVAELRKTLMEKYSKILKSPEIHVTLKTYSQYKVYVGGEVNHPQMVSLGDGKTTLQAIFEAGGFKNSAEMRSVLILRGIGEPSFRAIKVDLMKLFVSKRLVKNDLQLRANDVVYVPKTLIAKVNQFVDQYMNKIVPSQVFTDLVRGK